MKYTFLLFLAIFTAPAWAYGPGDYYNAGIQCYQQKQYDKAITYLKYAAKVDPQYWQAYQVLGTAYLQTGDQADAVNAFQTSLKIHPDNPALQSFVDRSYPNLGSNMPASAPLASTGMSVKPIVNPGSKAQYLFFNITAAFEEPFSGALAANQKAFQSQLSPGPENTDVEESEIFGGGIELGYELDKENALSVCVYGTVGTSGPAFNYENYESSPYSSLNENIQAGAGEFGIRYYRYLPETAGRWFGFVGADYYSLNVVYQLNQDQGTYPSESSSNEFATLGGNTFGGTIGIGRQFDIFDFLSVEASVAFKYANISQVTGSYTANVVNGSSTTTTTGQGTLVTLSNGAIVLLDQKYVGSATVTNFDFTGIEGRAAFNIWF